MDVALSYTIWFSQRTGSTWFADLLEATGIAGTPREHLNFPHAQAALDHYDVSDSRGLRAKVLTVGTGDNGVFGIKHSFHQPAFDHLLSTLAPSWDPTTTQVTRLAVWEELFPHHRHIFITRRNKVRLAVSWWRAIQSGEWHRENGVPASSTDLRGAYDFRAIDHLVHEATMREAGIAELFADAGVVPLTLTYEDMVLSPRVALDHALTFLGLPVVALPASRLVPMADEVAEEWTQRYRKKRQKKWDNRGW